MRERLKTLILKHAFQYSEKPIFKLAHGGTSRYYFNCKQITLDPEGQYLIGSLVFEIVRQYNVDAIGGLTLGADAISTAVAYTSWLKKHPLQAFIVRKQEKDHGIINRIEGKVKKGDRVIVVDDVITTGESTLQAITACQNAGLDVIGVVTLIDRQETNGRQKILQVVPHFSALFTRDDIVNRTLKRSK